MKLKNKLKDIDKKYFNIEKKFGLNFDLLSTLYLPLYPV